jgi:multimeric flavodoxin WrbA
MKNGVIIQGSARSNGDTSSYAHSLKLLSGYDLIDLLDYDIGHFDYNFNNTNDDFLPLIKKILSSYGHIVLATPVYWYTMSGHMKVFLDRISDLLYNEKETGRRFRSKAMSVLSVSNEDDIEDTFYLPFRQSAAYLGMDYLAECHACSVITNAELQNRLQRLIPA